VGFSDDEIVFDLKTWEEWLEANPNLVNIVPAISFNTFGKEMKKYQIGWRALILTTTSQ
jgi:hypothetical protein